MTLSRRIKIMAGIFWAGSLGGISVIVSSMYRQLSIRRQGLYVTDFGIWGDIPMETMMTDVLNENTPGIRKFANDYPELLNYQEPRCGVVCMVKVIL